MKTTLSHGAFAALLVSAAGANAAETAQIAPTVELAQTATEPSEDETLMEDMMGQMMEEETSPAAEEDPDLLMDNMMEQMGADEDPEALMDDMMGEMMGDAPDISTPDEDPEALMDDMMGDMMADQEGTGDEVEPDALMDDMMGDMMGDPDASSDEEPPLFADEGEAGEADTNFVAGGALSRIRYGLKTELTGYLREPNDPDVNDSRGYGITQLDAATDFELSDSWTLNMHLVARVSTEGKEHVGAFQEPGRSSSRAHLVDTKELNLRWEGDDYGATIGRAAIPVGLASLYSPTDQFEQHYAAHPPMNEKTGRWLTQLDAYIDDDTLSVTFLPFDERLQSPPSDSRWQGESSNYEFFSTPFGDVSTSTDVTNDYRNETLDNWGYLVRYSGKRSGGDFYTGTYWGPSAYSVIREVNGVRSSYRPIVAMAMGGANLLIDRWELYGEGLVQHARNYADVDLGKYLLGVSYRETEFANSLGLNEIKPILEYAGEWIFDSQIDSSFIADSEASRPFRQALLGNLRVEVDDEWSGSLFGAYNFDESDRTGQAEIQYQPSDNLNYKVRYSYFMGDDETHFGRWSDNSNITFGIEYKF